MLGSLTVELRTLTGKFDKGMHNARGSLRSVEKQAGNTKKILAGLFAIAGGVQFVRLTKDAMQYTDQLAKTADKLGSTTEGLAGLRHAADLTGVANSKLDMSLQRMTRRIAEASQGLGEGKAALKELGLNAQALSRMRPEQAFEQISKAMGEVDGQSNKVRISFKLFDSEGVDLVRTLALGEKGLQAAAVEAKQLGLAVSRVDAAKVEMANDAFTRAGSVVKGLANAIAVQVAPIVGALANHFTDSAKQAGGFGTVASSSLRGVTQSVGFLADGVQYLSIGFKVVQVAVHEFAALVWEDLAWVDRGLTAFLNNLPGVSAKTSASMQQIAKGARRVADEAAKSLSDSVNADSYSDQFTQFFNKIEADAQKTAEAVAATRGAVAPTGEGVNFAASEAAEKEAARYSKQLEKQLDALRESQLTEREALEAWQLEKSEIVNDAFENKLVQEQEQQSLLLGVHKEYQDRLSKIEKDGSHEREQFRKASFKVQAKSVIDDLVSVTQGVAQHNRKLFEINKAAGIASALINAHEGASMSMAKYPWPLAGVMAGLHYAAGIARVQAIRSTSFGGGGGAAPSSAGTGAGGPVVTPIPSGVSNVGEDTNRRTGTTTQIIVQGNVMSEDFVREQMIPLLSDAVNNSDFVLIDGNSRQAAELQA